MMTFLVKCLIPGGKNQSHFTLSLLCLPIPIRCKKTLARMSEKFCVQWNDYSDSVKEGFKTLKTNSDFSDVTLACEDGQQIDAHKVVLVSTSPFFHNLLKRNNHPHPLIYMKGIKFEDLSAIIDFLYFGEVEVLQKNLNAFFALAEDLQLKGMKGEREALEEKYQGSHTNLDLKQSSIKASRQSEKHKVPTSLSVVCKKEPLLNEGKSPEQKFADHVSTDLQELDAQVKSMMEESQNIIRDDKKERAKKCKLCGKEGALTTIRDHIEVHHLEGIVLPCNTCEKAYKSRTSFRQHKCKPV